MKTYEEYKVSGVKWLGKVPKTLGNMPFQRFYKPTDTDFTL